VDEPVEVAAESPAVAEEPVDGAPKRKRSRRGSRGGKKRRKPGTADGDETPAVADEAPVEKEPVAVADAPEYVPMSEWIDDFGSRP
jgi:hypothetical protein